MGAFSLSRAVPKPVRRALKRVVPSAVVAAWKGSGVKRYATFEAAAQASPSLYDSELLTRFRVAKAKLNAAQVRSDALPSGYCLLLATVSMLDASESTICDFGGACGEWSLALSHDVRSRSFSTTVVETPSLAHACAADPFFNAARWTTELPESFDVFLASGALQYVADPYAILGRAFARAKRFVLIARTTFAPQESFSVQTTPLKNNGFGALVPAGAEGDAVISYPRRVLALPRVLALADAAGWRVKVQLAAQESHGFGGAAVERDMLFERRG